ncbi:hypothetical protein [Streptomyces qaidamensis]|uniref:hypothetical protein n=1 Tax=Streptomyces qaidamensis TaxID=1783515 RepID=UPI001F18D3E5|nr:hypothetical protein [Streptomyces qaidamensis]
MDLHLRGPVETDLPGTIRTGAVDDAPAQQPPSPPAVAARARLREPAAPECLVKYPDIRLAVALMRIPLAEAGLLRRPLLGPTRAAPPPRPRPAAGPPPAGEQARPDRR